MHAWLHTQQVFAAQTLPQLCEFLELFGPIAGVIILITYSHHWGIEVSCIIVCKVSFLTDNTGWGAHLPHRTNGPDSFFPLCGSPYNSTVSKPVTFPAMSVPIYTPGSREVIEVKCLTLRTQHIDHNRA